MATGWGDRGRARTRTRVTGQKRKKTYTRSGMNYGTLHDDVGVLYTFIMVSSFIGYYTMVLRPNRRTANVCTISFIHHRSCCTCVAVCTRQYQDF